MQANRNVDEVPVPSREFEMLRRLLARLQRLLGKAEAVDLLKISAHRRRRHVVGGLARRHPRGFVSHRIIDRDDLAEPHVDRPAFRLERPRQTGRDIGIEADRDDATGQLIGRVFCHLRGATEPGGTAKPEYSGTAAKETPTIAATNPPQAKATMTSRVERRCRIIADAPATRGPSPASRCRTTAPAGRAIWQSRSSGRGGPVAAARSA